MKNIKKLLSIVMVLTLVLSLGASAFASTITISDADENSTFTAYKLLNATYDSDTGLYQYTLNETFNKAVAAGLTAAGINLEVTEANESKVVDAISKLDADATRKFADAAFAAIDADAEMKAAGEQAGEGAVFNNMEGYYLIAETVNSADGNAVTSLVMLGTYGNENKTVTTKEDKPSSEKKVKEKNDTTGNETGWQDAADYDIGDSIPYQLSAKIQNQGYEKYTTYSLKFVDTLSKGLTYEKTTAVYYKDADGTQHDLSLVEPTSAPYAGEEPDPYAGGTVLTWSFEDLKTLGVPAGATLYVEYTARLDSDAVIGPAGNPNEMHIEYSNNPYGNGTGKTPDSKVTVFTFELDVNKVDGAGKALEGAGFTLLKQVTAPKGVEAPEVTWETLGEKAKNDYVTYNGKTYQVFHEEITDKTTFVFEGLDSAEYLLVETTVPKDYNRADDITITVEATYTQTDDPKLTGLTVTPADIFTATLESGTITGNVVNLTGVELPSTGGIGTTIFYVVGGILVAAAVILLVTRRRVTGAEK